MKQLLCKTKDKQTNEIKNVGRLEIKNKSDGKSELYFYGDIVNDEWESYWTEANKCPQEITDFLAELEDMKEIDIYVNSGGGDVHAGLAIYNQLKRHKGYKRAYIDGIGASISSIIPFACDEVNLYTCSQLMIHKPWGGMIGDANDFRKRAEILDSCQTAITNIYMEHVKDGVEREKITELIDAETWFTGAEAQEYFNVNIITDDGSVGVCNSSFYNRYKKQPQNLENKNEVEKAEIEKLQAQLELLCM